MVYRLILFFLCFVGVGAMSAEDFMPREVRATWMTTYGGLDWPRRKAQQREDFCRQLDELQACGINTVIFQARVRATVLYPSQYEPWDECLTGHYGQSPNYDPLQMAVEECHKRHMECHAWVVCFPVGKKKQNINARLKPLVQKCGDQWIMDPSKSGTADYIADICEEIVKNYDVDGIQLDYIRYPEHEIPFRMTGTAQERRDNVTRVVKTIHDRVKAVRPWVKMSCSPVGKYADLPRQSSYGWNARDAVYQDARKWLEDGLMDWLAPMMYFDGRHFYPFVADWATYRSGKPVVPGLGIYFLSPQEKNWDLRVITRQLHVIRQHNMGGHAFFRTRFLLDNTKGLYDFVKTFNREPALIPAMTWMDSIPPTAPMTFEFRREGYTLHFSWNAVNDDTPVRYNLYRLENGRATVLARDLRDTDFTYSPALPAYLHGTFIVTAFDAYGNESKGKKITI